ncbi:hypothetical protein [Streptomyces sp. NBC_00519]|uniref:hypothetical protein n=1 Tax=Streptomyces sp. NBC_00519 TaxID=2975764 RepID=UPI0030DEC602
MNSHSRYARGLAAGAVCLAFAGVAVAVWSALTFGLDDGGYVVPVVGLLYGGTVLAWLASRERAAEETDRHAHIELLGEIPPRGRT